MTNDGKAIDAGGQPPGSGSGWAAVDACTLPTVEQPLRVAEFDRLFADALRGVERVAPTLLRLDLDAAARTRAEDLAARETDCCSFFSFTITATVPGRVRMDIEVLPEQVAVLDGVTAHALAAA